MEDMIQEFEVVEDMAFNGFLHAGNTKQCCRAAIIASKGIEVCPLAAYTDEDTSSALAYINGRLTCIVSSYTYPKCFTKSVTLRLLIDTAS